MRVYVAGPYTLGSTAANVRAAIDAGQKLFIAGHTPYIPHLSHLWSLVYPMPYAHWMQLGLDWLHQCEAVLRLPGESAGADVEVSVARSIGIPVFFNVLDLAPEADDDYDL